MMKLRRFFARFHKNSDTGIENKIKFPTKPVENVHKNTSWTLGKVWSGFDNERFWSICGENSRR
jgi:hypothetical protein